MKTNADGSPDLEKVADPFAADPQTQTPAVTETPAETPAPVEPTAEEMKAENAALKAQLSAAQNVKVTVQAPAPVEAPIQPMTAEQLQAQAESLGFTDPKQVESIGKIAAHVAAPAYQKAAVLEQELKVERAVNSAKKAALAADPQFSKLEAHVDEFLDSVPVYEKTDPEKLKGHMERATFYARGKMGVSAPQRRTTPTTQTREEDPQKVEGGMKGPEFYQTQDGKVSITITPRVTDAVRKMHSHPVIEGGVQIDPREEWKGPVFQKDLIK